MKDAYQRAVVVALMRGLGLTLLLCAGCFAEAVRANDLPSRVLCRPDFSIARRVELAAKLREITGWSQLGFDVDGALRHVGEINLESEGERANSSRAARELIATVIAGENVIVLEDASRRRDVVFCRVVQGRWTRAEIGMTPRPPVFVVLIDFADFEHVRGDRAARDAFHVGWTVLHEVAHVVHNLDDAANDDDRLGACERLINRMRRECGLQVERAAYHFNYLPGARTSEFLTRFVRLAFDHHHPQTNERKRLWLIWDAHLVGGLELETTQITGHLRIHARRQ